MNVSRYFGRFTPVLSAAAFFLAAGLMFFLKYGEPSLSLPLYFDAAESSNRLLFYINFYVPYILWVPAVYGCFFGKGFLIRVFCLLTGFAAAVIAGYVLEDILTIKLCLYSGFIIITASSFPFRTSLLLSLSSTAAFCLLLFHPRFFGAALGLLSFVRPETSHIILLSFYLSTLAFFSASLRLLVEKHRNAEETITHLNLVGTRMLLFNHRLQEYAKNFGEEAVRKDRLRFTSDLHDSCGYVFTNIIAMSDAAISCAPMDMGRLSETFHLIQSQAREGLKKTRETLHMIRELQEPSANAVEVVYQMKSLFEEVTGIKVEIETGNMKQDYGAAINSIIARIVQEAFTNSIRHGKASRIQIQFWEFPQSLTMVVTDNGVGAKEIVKGIGLAGMEERLASVGGSLSVSSSSGDGFRLKVEIPLAAAEQARLLYPAEAWPSAGTAPGAAAGEGVSDAEK
jgi:signal transduction histidine kinase